MTEWHSKIGVCSVILQSDTGLTQQNDIYNPEIAAWNTNA